MINSDLSRVLKDCGCQILEELLPRVALVTSDQEAIARLIGVAAEHRLRICTMGTGSSFSPDYNPQEDQIFLLMTQMNQIVDLRHLDAVVVVESGVLALDLAGRLDGTDLELPGVIANYSGTMGGAILGPDTTGERHTEIKRRLLGIEVIDSKGRRLKYGGSAIKNVTGYDYWTFLVGTGGRFGVLTRLILNLEKMPAFGPDTPQELPCDSKDSPAQWIFANLCKGLDPDGIFVP